MQDDSAHTVSAAAVVLAAAARSTTGLHHNHDHAAVTKKRWWSRLTANLCFRPHGHPRRIADHTAAAAYIHHSQQPVFAFVAPPSSPASSLFASEAPSPVLLHNASSPTSIFAIGPYARGPQQLVSPPVLSTFTTEPSTAPLTPPPESAYLHLATNPSSPEVPFARILASSALAEQQCCGEGFHSYQLHPGSPVGATLVSPPRKLGPEEIASRRLRARNEGSLLDGHIPPSGGAVSFGAASTAGSEEGGLEEDELPKSGEFVFGNGDGQSVDGEARNKWPFFPMVEHGMI